MILFNIDPEGQWKAYQLNLLNRYTTNDSTATIREHVPIEYVIHPIVIAVNFSMAWAFMVCFNSFHMDMSNFSI